VGHVRRFCGKTSSRSFCCFVYRANVFSRRDNYSKSPRPKLARRVAMPRARARKITRIAPHNARACTRAAAYPLSGAEVPNCAARRSMNRGSSRYRLFIEAECSLSRANKSRRCLFRERRRDALSGRIASLARAVSDRIASRGNLDSLLARQLVLLARTRKPSMSGARFLAAACSRIVKPTQ